MNSAPSTPTKLVQVAARVVTLASGSGSLFQALIDSTSSAFQLVGLVCDRVGIAAIDRADAAGIPISIVDPNEFADRSAWDAALADSIESFSPDLVVSAGFMRVIGPEGVQRFRGRLINTHPALLPEFPGAHAVRDAIAAGVSVTGSTVHFVDEGVDTGPVIRQESVAVLPGDDEATLHERIKQVERRLLVDVVTELAQQKDKP